MTTILGIETSCDETAAAVVMDGEHVRSNVIASQHDLHARYGGVVPEIASRAHLQRIDSVVEEALQRADATFEDLGAVAVGNRPGLIGSLLVGTSAAKALAWRLDRPLIGVDHIRAHLYAAAMKIDADTSPDHAPPQRTFPALGLVVSGGHTCLFDLSSPTDMRILGRTIDDAVGEAYDKAAVILDLGYPGGPRLDAAARRGDPNHCRLPRSLLGESSLDFSFSGLKTALLYTVRGLPRKSGTRTSFERTAADLEPQRRLDLAASFQEAAIEVLILKLQRALDAMTAAGRAPRALLIGGGVSANSLLRWRVVELSTSRGLPACVPPMPLCVDNAAMIAGLAFEQMRLGQTDDLHLAAMAKAE